MEVSKEMIAEFKAIYKKKEGEELGDQEAYESASNLLNLYSTFFDISMKTARKDRRLKKEPDGFPVDGQYSCLVCGNSINESNGWYHRGGQRCLTCHKAVKEGVVPQFIFEHRDSFYKMWQLKDTFKVHPQTARKYIREGKLKARTIMNENGTVHEHIFLKKENPALIEPYNPIRKSYNKNREKVSKRWAREKAKEIKTNRKKLVRGK